MSVFRIILTILLIIDCLAAVVVILMQEGKDAGLGAMAGAAGNSDSYWSRNKNRSYEGKLILFTRILVIMFFVLSILLNLKVI